MTNMVGESYDELMFLTQRPGLVLTKQVEGAGNGVVCYNGGIVAMWGDVLDYVTSTAAPYNAGTTYDIFDVAFYDGIWWISTQEGNTGNTPAVGSSYWSPDGGETTWDDATQYDIGDTVQVLGTTYYATTIGTNKPPYRSASSPYWSLTQPTTERWTNNTTLVVSTSLSAAARQAFDGYSITKLCSTDPGFWVTYAGPFFSGSWYAGTNQFNGTCLSPTSVGAGFIPQILIQTHA